MSGKVRHASVNTALHVIKGAIVQVLHAPLTTSTEAHKKDEGRITIEFTKEPTKEQLQKIEDLSNQKIRENVEIRYFKMDRAEAEEKYSKAPVNETFIYDKFPVPAEVKELNIVEIPDWNVNCSVGPLLKSTGELNGIKIKRINFRSTKNEVEFVFGLESSSPSKTNQSQKQKEEIPTKIDYTDVKIMAENLVKECLTEVKSNGIDLKDKEQNLKQSLQFKVEQKLTLLKNASYSQGFSSTPNQTQMHI